MLARPGVEPGTSGVVDKRLIHSATEASYLIVSKLSVSFGTCYEVEKSIILTTIVMKLVISVTSDFLAFIRPSISNLALLGMKSRPHFGQKALRKQISQFPDNGS